MGATTVERKLSRPRAHLRNQSGGDGPRPAKLPYGGLNRIRFEGCVSTIAGTPAWYPRFRMHFTMHGGRGPAMRAACDREGEDLPGPDCPLRSGRVKAFPIGRASESS
jgi:hypothetical protein